MAEIFITYRTFCFLSSIKIWTKSNDLLESYKVHNYENITVQSEYNGVFFKVLLFFFWKKVDKEELFFTDLLLKEFSFFSYSLQTASSATGEARVAFV